MAHIRKGLSPADDDDGKVVSMYLIGMVVFATNLIEV